MLKPYVEYKAGARTFQLVCDEDAKAQEVREGYEKLRPLLDEKLAKDLREKGANPAESKVQPNQDQRPDQARKPQRPDGSDQDDRRRRR